MIKIATNLPCQFGFRKSTLQLNPPTLQLKSRVQIKSTQRRQI
jgi:hypothetical protein